MRRTTSPGPRRAAAALAAALLATCLSALPPLVSAQTAGPAAPRSAPAPDRDPGLSVETAVDLQRQINDLRGDLLDDRERQIDRRQQGNGAVMVVLGVLIGIGGLWTCAKFQAIARDARIGAEAARGRVVSPPDLPRRPGAIGGASDAMLPPVPWMDGPVLPAAGPPDSNGHLPAPGPGPVPSMPQRPEPAGSAESGWADDEDLQRCEEVVADCTEAIRLDPENPGLYLERGNARSGLGHFEQAVADYDRAVALDPDNVAAHLGRCRANSELGRHDEAIEDYERLVSLDPDAAGEVGEF